MRPPEDAADANARGRDGGGERAMRTPVRTHRSDAVRLGPRMTVCPGDVVRFVGGGLFFRGRRGVDVSLGVYRGPHRVRGWIRRGARLWLECRPVERGGLLGEQRIVLVAGRPVRDVDLGIVLKPSRVVRPRGVGRNAG